jgi:hypothetical protein
MIRINADPAKARTHFGTCFGFARIGTVLFPNHISRAERSSFCAASVVVP